MWLSEMREMSHRICKTAKELSEAIKEETDVIEVEGDLSNKIVRIKVTGKVAWAVCAVSLAAAISFAIAAGATAAVPPVGGAHLVGFTAAMGTSASILGSAAVPALTIGICAGGIGALTALRNRYSIVKKAKGSVVLKRKKSQ